MNTVSLAYRFRQKFGVAAKDAFDWCTDFGPKDGSLFSTPVRRTVKWVNDSTLVMTDTKQVDGKTVRIARLVRILPSELAWTNTHLNGPYRHSQFWYRIVADGPRRSHLEFTGLAIREVPGRVSTSARSRLAEGLRKDDAAEWRTRLAPALESDLARN